MSREIEYKYKAGRMLLDCIHNLYSGWESITMETHYYDTEDGFLAKRKWMLRLRRENGTPVCCLKVPLEKNTCGEWETEAPSIEAAIPELCKLGAPEELLTLGSLRETCSAQIHRAALKLPLEGAVAELALDAGTLRGGGREQTLRELEIEHKEGDPDVTRQFAAEFAEKYALTEEPLSKIARARALAEGDGNG